MSHVDDTARVRELLAPADPVRSIRTLDDDVAAVRPELTTAGEHRWMRVAAVAAVALLVAGSFVPMVRPPAAWAIEDVPEVGTVIRVELPGVLQRGPDPDEVVTALRDHGVAVEIVHSINLAPWKVGRTIGIGYELGGRLPEGFMSRFLDLDETDFTEVGITRVESGGFIVHPETFNGTVTIHVGRLPWQDDPAIAQP
jgi:hypothetical protein